jgi:RimK family alpha-L-glutamate ligase
MELAIFTTCTKAYAPGRLKEEAGKAGLTATVIGYRDLHFRLNDNGVEIKYHGSELPRFETAIFRGGTCLTFAPQRNILIGCQEKTGTRIINRESCLRWPVLDKLTQHFIFSQANLPVISTEFLGNKSELKEGINGKTVIVKSIEGSRGRQVYKISDSRGMEEVLSKYRANRLIVQPFLSTGEDIRVVVVGGKAIGAMRRTARPGTYLTSYSAGGIVQNYDLNRDAEAEELAIKVAGAAETDFGGIDLMRDETGRWRVLEINRDCQFKGFEKVTGVNVAKAVIDYLINMVNLK